MDLKRFFVGIDIDYLDHSGIGSFEDCDSLVNAEKCFDKLKFQFLLGNFGIYRSCGVKSWRLTIRDRLLHEDLKEFRSQKKRNNFVQCSLFD